MKKNIFFKAKKIVSRKTESQRAQSMVEFAIALPVLLLLLTGMVEFGFMLNTYLSIQDAARATARRYSTVNPFNADGTDNLAFYQDAALYAVDLLAPAGDPQARQIVIEEGRDNILVSLVGVEVTESTDPNVPDSISSITRYSGAEFYQLFTATNPPTTFVDDNITTFLTTGGAEPADAGLLIIEIYYGYEGTLNLPWLRPIFSPENPSMLYVSVVMPTIYAKPFD
jgi:Flp pilus assembly protein TadG